MNGLEYVLNGKNIKFISVDFMCSPSSLSYLDQAELQISQYEHNASKSTHKLL